MITIEEYAKEQNLPEIEEIKIRIGGAKITIYRLYSSKNTGAKIGLPFFAIPTKDGYRQATPDEVFKINTQLYGDDE